MTWDTQLLPQLEEVFRTRPSELSVILRADSSLAPSYYPYRLIELHDEALSSEPRVAYEPLALQSMNSVEQREVLRFLVSQGNS